MKFPELDRRRDHRHHHHHHHNHEHCEKKENRDAKRSHKIMKRIAKLEKKLGKYSFDSSVDSSTTSSSSSSSSSSDEFNSRPRSLSRLPRDEKHSSCRRRRRRRCRTSHEGRGRIGSSDSGSSSSESPSPQRRRRRRRQHGPPPPTERLSRSRSFAGRDHRSPFARGFHRHPHPPHHHHPHFSPPRHHRLHHNCGRFLRGHQDNGVQGCYLQILRQNDANVEVPVEPVEEDQQNLLDLTSRSSSVSREPDATDDATPAANDENGQGIDDEESEEIVTGPEINESLADNWSGIIRNGLPADAKRTILSKYPVSKNCLLLRGPKINPEILPVATEAAIERDTVQLSEQNQIATGLTALGNAITDLNNKTELKANEGVVDIIETLNDAANIILDTHHNMTQTRRAFMLPEINQKVRSVAEACEPSDELLYGNDLTENAKNVKGFGRGRKGCKRRNPENQREKGGKRKPKCLGVYREF